MILRILTEKVVPTPTSILITLENENTTASVVKPIVFV